MPRPEFRIANGPVDSEERHCIDLPPPVVRVLVLLLVLATTYS